MRPSDLPSVEQLARKRRHGHKIRYVAGCRCWRCRAGNAAYEKQLEENRRLDGPNDNVPTDRVRAHLKYLQKFGMGVKTVAKHARVSKTGLAEIVWYGKKLMRRRSEARVLAVQPTLDTLPRHLNIPAAETLSKIEQLIRWGYPKSLISQHGMGAATVGLQIRSLNGKIPTVTVKTAVKIRDFFAEIEGIRRAWQERRGAIPRGHFVYWKRSKRSCRIQELELQPFARTYNYNYIYPPELKEVMRLANKLKRTYQARSRHEKQLRRSS